MGFDKIIGQERALEHLRSMLREGRVPPALLFRGPLGVGKGLAAFEFAKALNCSSRKADSCSESPCPSCEAAEKSISPDIHRVDPAYQAALLDEEPAKQKTVKISTVRFVLKDLEMRSLGGAWKTAVIEDAHTLVPAAANALLKSLEEPPPRTLWILVTHRPAELLATIRSRCRPVVFAAIPAERVAAILSERGVVPEKAARAASLAEGSVSRAMDIVEMDLPSPSEWISDPLAPFQLADSLPKGLHNARPAVSDHIQRMAWHLRNRRGVAGLSAPVVRAALKELAELRGALRANADPKIVVELAAFKLQELHQSGDLP